MKDVADIKVKALALWKATIQLHRLAPETRIASSLSCVEILTTLFYGGYVKFDPRNPAWPERDRLIVSKGHGGICLYAILADLGFFSHNKLKTICSNGSEFGSIPDPVVPGIETVNGSLGHGIGVACGMALALRQQDKPQRVFVIAGDGELHEGSCWESIMFAGHHRLSKIILIVDNNRRCMLNDTKKVLCLDPLEDKLRSFGWNGVTVDGHNIGEIAEAMNNLGVGEAPSFLVARTVKGHGIRRLEEDPLCHVRTLRNDETDLILES